MLSEYKYKYEELVTINTNESRIRELSKSGFSDFLNNISLKSRDGRGADGSSRGGRARANRGPDEGLVQRGRAALLQDPMKLKLSEGGAPVRVSGSELFADGSLRGPPQ